MKVVDESSLYIWAQANLTELKLDEMGAAMPDYVRMVGAASASARRIGASGPHDRGRVVRCRRSSSPSLRC